ncbi:hypothetical protein QC763_107820 [Podospora pseudopauciseta]|uniref:Uncharacterized protein n=1 Tax=Podospora pseudopauciseta TaxID=2093780 RepID=A0ABR0HYN5_9PEZI|nr:hypothetical protein QC763_107820 [Podospora pseudopauciseta]
MAPHFQRRFESSNRNPSHHSESVDRDSTPSRYYHDIFAHLPTNKPPRRRFSDPITCPPQRTQYPNHQNDNPLHNRNPNRLQPLLPPRQIRPPLPLLPPTKRPLLGHEHQHPASPPVLHRPEQALCQV